MDTGDISFGLSNDDLIIDNTGAGDSGPLISKYADTVVENKGIFFFDYEKALHTHSKLSYVISPWKIERYLGLHVPWSYFQVKEVRLIRRERKFRTTMDVHEAASLDETLGDIVTISQTLKFRGDELGGGSTGTIEAIESIYSGYLDSDTGESFRRYGQPVCTCWLHPTSLRQRCGRRYG